jgi:hypothetical protein
MSFSADPPYGLLLDLPGYRVGTRRYDFERIHLQLFYSIADSVTQSSQRTQRKT